LTALTALVARVIQVPDGQNRNRFGKFTRFIN
jgi:hypothetical protein